MAGVYRVASRIARALDESRPVVALESTVITHGLPEPENLDLALGLEQTLRSAGAEPATVAVLDGRLVVGAEPPELRRLAAGRADKASLWNLGPLLAGGALAGTTVAATLHAASAVGIDVFATGGIGGVHDLPFDESADLRALGSYPVTTVCAGPKSILDAEATVERLESLGVPVVGYRTDRLAGFFVPETEWAVPLRCDSPEEVATFAKAQRELGMSAGLLVCKPVSSGLTAAELDGVLKEARSEAQAAGVKGKDLTPYLLKRLAALSEGRSVAVNLRLLEENAALAAAIASALHPAPHLRSLP